MFMKNRKTIRGLMAALLAFAMLFAFMPLAFAAEDEGFILTELPDNSWSLDPIPLLVIKISFDANKNGIDDYDMSNGSKLYSDKTSPYYGEQWSYSTDKYWYNAFFSNDKSSMKTYYKEVSNGSFYFCPAEETYESKEKQGVVNDGVVNVVIPYKHPMATTGGDSKEDSNSRNAALRAAAEYVDFSKFDKNGDGKISYNELAIVYVCGGYEASANSSRPSDKLAFGVHAHYTSNTPQKIDGVEVGASFLRVGEYLDGTQPLTVGTIAHELGHFIGSPDLYDTSSTGTKWNYAGDMTLMASGSWNNYSGTPRGASPAYLDPYNAISCGLMTPTDVNFDGEYTLYSRNSKEGEYNILKVYTPNPKEYYLIENRYHETGSTKFDAINSSNMAIVIWHIDESIAESWRGVNAAASGHDPGVVPMGISSIGATLCGFKYINGSSDGRSYTFEAGSGKYRFPVSGTSYTTLTPEQAENFNLKITVKEGSFAGDEMTITVSGVHKMAPGFGFSAREADTSSITFKGTITNLYGGDVRGIKMMLSTKSDVAEGDSIVKTVVPNADGTFSVVFDGLEQNTKYFCKTIVSGKNGDSERTIAAYTKVEKKPRTDYYYVYFFKGLTAVDRRYGVKVKPGETLSYKFPMEKRGYDFCGWYLDPELTTRYDMGFTQTVCEDFPLYAKWVETGRTATLKLSGAESKYLLFAFEIGDSFDEPVPAKREGYKFVGWYEDEELTLPYDFGQTVDEAGEITIYAKWEKEGGEDPGTTTTQPPATETTTSAVTTEPNVTTTPSVTTDGGKGGCKSVMGAGASIAVIGIIGVALAVGRKKKEE